MNKVVIGVGSNIDAEKNIANARKKIETEFTFIKSSSFSETLPVNVTHQPNFLNGAFLIQTKMSLQELKIILKKIEQELGRDGSQDKNSPRKIDLDIVIWNGSVQDQDIYERDFIREATLEICPELSHLFSKNSIQEKLT